MSKRLLLVAALCYLALLPNLELHAQIDSTPRTILDVRVYQDGSFVFRFTPAANAGCQFNDHTLTPPTAPAYKLISALALTAYTSHRQVLLIFNGCSGGGGVGNVNLTGLVIPQQ